MNDLGMNLGRMVIESAGNTNICRVVDCKDDCHRLWLNTDELETEVEGKGPNGSPYDLISYKNLNTHVPNKKYFIGLWQI